MKLNLKRTIFIGLAFFAVTAFWQMYDNVIPLILKNTFHLGDTLQGVIMAMDNVLALFLLPLFGSLSDKTHSRIGKRMPYIIIGTALASVFSIAIPLIDNSYFASPDTGKYVAFVIVLGALLFSMGIFRSPAVALMPDLTPRPLRSQGNAIINLMGAVGAIMILLVSQVLFSDDKVKNLAHVDYLPIFVIVVGLMILSVIILFFTINENKIAATLPVEEDDDEENKKSDKRTIEVLKSMPRAVRISLLLILLSVAFWYMGYNAVTTSFTKFAQQEWGMELGSASRCLTIATGVAVVSYIPVGAISSKIGRKKSIIIGVIMLGSAFTAFAVCSFTAESFSGIMYVFLAVLGFAWAAINVNSLPMVVELATGDEIGRFTGYYYSFSMAAQILTPVLSGFFLEFVGYKTLFIYAAFFVFLSLMTMLGVKHGDNRPSN
ncbi:MAG: MFS transporter [Clostridia bacterium]|nr:MFS transporter [Clostridia bacterium]